MNERQFNNALEELKRVTGPFFSYRLNFDKTIIPKDYLGSFFNRLLTITNDLFGSKPLEQLRILDLGSYEGIYSIGFAQLGATVISVEGKQANFKKLAFAKDFLALKNLEIVKADVRTITKESYGEFDLVLACGIMYHLDSPSVFNVTKNIFAMAKRAAIIDTHIALARPIEQLYEGRTYWGRYHKEFEVGTPMVYKELKLANSLDNEISFWMTRISWLNFLKALKFSSVYECLLPFAEQELGYYDRATFVAVKNAHTTNFFSSSSLRDTLSEQIGESLPTQHTEAIPSNPQGLLIR